MDLREWRWKAICTDWNGSRMWRFLRRRLKEYGRMAAPAWLVPFFYGVRKNFVVAWCYIKKVLFVREIYGFTEFLGSDLALCRKIVS